jgi:hypothetical protein
MKISLRERMGVLLKDRLRYERCLRSPSRAYLSLSNRYERLQEAPDGIGYACQWQYTSRLHAPAVQPGLGQRLLRRCLSDAPIVRRPTPLMSPLGRPQISILIGHRGTERLPLLQATLESLAAQQRVLLECLVIEQDTTPRVRDHLPDWVRHVHDHCSESLSFYNRSRAFNVGAQHARAPVLLLHDNDMLVPSGYCQRLLDRITLGYKVVNPKRFIFYLDQRHTQRVLHSQAPYDEQPAEAIVQNLEAGGSMAITREAYAELGGMDEEFVGWGGEDNEFWDRCLTLPTWVWGYEPIVHLWHRSQPLKQEGDNPNIIRCREVMERSPQERIALLRQRISLNTVR